MISRRAFVAQAAALGGALAAGGTLWGLERVAPVAITVYKSRSCGCCADWVDYLKAAGFTPVVHDDEDMDTVKDSLGVPRNVRSCHTAQVDKYLIEGHVPAPDIQRLLKERPKVAGLAVPGMPPSSPGMARPGTPHQPFETVAFQHDGSSILYARH